MKKLLLAVIICSIISFGLMGCGKKAGEHEHPAGHEHPSSEHPK